jgi:hypothetical protein
MHVIYANNVRDALLLATDHIVNTGRVQTTRAGEAMVATNPVTIMYAQPKQHVLSDPTRDANPFFHLMEAMWMLTGREDGVFLDYYVKDFSKNYGVNGVILDSYGYRWRHGYRYDQLDEIVSQLRRDQTTRQAVLSMWGAGVDDLRASAGKPCNLSAVFSIQQGFLNMTVFNRSNDLIWGCCGANAVHFALLLEYIASRLNVPMGSYWQVTNNLHIYTEEYERLCKRGGDRSFLNTYRVDPYGTTMPLMNDSGSFSADLQQTMDYIDALHGGRFVPPMDTLSNTFLSHTVARMALAHYLYKHGEHSEALDIAETVAAEDWRIAGLQWLLRHKRSKI